MFTEFEVYAEVDPCYMVEFDDANVIELAYAYGADKNDIVNIDNEEQPELAYKQLNQKFLENRLGSYWPVISLIFKPEDKIILLQPNGMLDNRKLIYEGMTIYEFMKELSNIDEDSIENIDDYQIALDRLDDFIVYFEVKIDVASCKVILTFKHKGKIK